ncbi:hypothetical protein [Haloferula rosea]|uniref:Uncharacterized protein n=1 Tax=Haloferula rosea TaxID=490093 RepID=A0A934R8H6_9BACT|nr:hypothetical protein [Haloferula rosea]MBK1826237.1 hypothetical protein [Haloferula rosea]
MRFLIAIAWVWVLMLSNCVGLKGQKHTYTESGGAVEVGGAEVGIDFRPEGTRPGSFMMSAMVVGGGMATFDGPFKWRIEAYGREGVHESLVVHRIRTRTEKTGRDEWFPADELGRKATFRKLRDRPGEVRARYPIPGLLKVMPEEDGKLDVWLDVSVQRTDATSRKLVRFSLDPSVKRQDEFIFLPVEVAQNIGTKPEDWEDSMWD